MTTLVPEPSTLLTRVAATLERDVLPDLPVSYARTEVEAAVTMLRQLAGRLEWRQDDLVDDLSGIDDALGAAGAPPRSTTIGPGAVATFAELHEAREQLGGTIDELFTADPSAVAGVAAVLRRMLDHEDERNRRWTRTAAGT